MIFSVFRTYYIKDIYRIMRKIKNNSENREQLFMRLYREVFPLVASFIQLRGGNQEEARDIFQDALVVYYQKLVSGIWEEKSEISTHGYLLSICRNMWYNKANKVKNLISLNPDDQEIPFEENTEIANEKMLAFVSAVSKKCLEILQSFYYHKQSMHDLASEFGFSSTRSATVQKYKCLEKVRDKIKETKLVYEDFTE